MLTDFREETNQAATGSGGAFENEKPACGMMGMFAEVRNTIKRHSDEDAYDLVARLKTAMTTPGYQ